MSASIAYSSQAGSDSEDSDTSVMTSPTTKSTLRRDNLEFIKRINTLERERKRDQQEKKSVSDAAEKHNFYFSLGDKESMLDGGRNYAREAKKVEKKRQQASLNREKQNKKTKAAAEAATRAAEMRRKKQESRLRNMTTLFDEGAADVNAAVNSTAVRDTEPGLRHLPYPISPPRSIMGDESSSLKEQAKTISGTAITATTIPAILVMRHDSTINLDEVQLFDISKPQDAKLMSNWFVRPLQVSADLRSEIEAQMQLYRQEYSQAMDDLFQNGKPPKDGLCLRSHLSGEPATHDEGPTYACRECRVRGFCIKPVKVHGRGGQEKFVPVILPLSARHTIIGAAVGSSELYRWQSTVAVSVETVQGSRPAIEE